MSWMGGMMGGIFQGVGGNLEGLGAAAQAVSTNRAGRQARDWYATQTGQGGQRLGDLVYGGGAYNDLVKSSVLAGNGDNAGAAKYSDKFNNAIGGSLTQQSDAMIGNAAGTGIQNDFANQTGSLTGLSEMQRRYLGDLYKGNTGTLLGNMRVGDQGLLSAYDQGARGVMSDANAFGAGRENIINRDAQKSAKATDQATSARLAASGFGNSTAGIQMRAGNARNVEDSRQSQLQNLHDSQAAARLGTSQNLLAGRTGLMTGQQNLQNQALAGRLGSQENTDLGQLNQYLARMYDRSSQGTQLAENGLNRQLGAQSAKIGLLSNTGQSSAMNPWLNQNTLGYYPGVSGIGQAAIINGQTMKQYGAQLSGGAGGGGGGMGGMFGG